METARSLRYVITRTVRPASSARRDLSLRTVRTQATRGILVPSLVLAALGTVVVASPGHVSSGHVRSDVVLTRACRVGHRPWMYAPAIRTGPWAYGSSAISGPQMNTITIKTAWMYAIPAIRTRPWMYTPPDSLRVLPACRAHGAPA